MTENNNEFKPNFYIVSFKRDRLDYFIDRSHIEYKAKEWVVVQAERGKDMGRIVRRISEEYMQKKSDRKYPLEILKRADEEDICKIHELCDLENKALEQCQNFVNYHSLVIKLVDAEYQYDMNKLTFYYTAEQRVDFRELVKDLASAFRTRIELRQIGVRDEAKKLGGLGPCGREICCAKWLDDFKTVTSQNARDQQLAVNPSKISGLCGRLMCCLTYEQEFYDDLISRYPNPDDKIMTDLGEATIMMVDMVRDKIWLRFKEEDDPELYKLSDLKKIRTSRKDFLCAYKKANTAE